MACRQDQHDEGEVQTWRQKDVRLFVPDGLVGIFQNLLLHWHLLAKKTIQGFPGNG